MCVCVCVCVCVCELPISRNRQQIAEFVKKARKLQNSRNKQICCWLHEMATKKCLLHEIGKMQNASLDIILQVTDYVK